MGKCKGLGRLNYIQKVGIITWTQRKLKNWALTETKYWSKYGELQKVERLTWKKGY